MPITIIKNTKPKLDKIHFECDDIIHKKLEEWELTKLFLNKSNTTTFIGRPCSGKTSLLMNIVKKLYKKCFHHVYVFMPATSRKSLKDNIFDKLDQSQIYDELSQANIREVYELVKVHSANGERSLIVYDDVQKSLKDQSVLTSLKNMIANQRHLKLVNLILLQNYFALDKSLREIITNVVMFKMNKTQTEKIFDEVVEGGKDMFEEVRDLVFSEPYKWLFINVASQRIFDGFDEIVWSNEDDDEIEL